MTVTDQQLVGVLKRDFGYDTFRDGQLDVLHAVLNQHSTLAILPTGAGKTLLYQLPAKLLTGSVVVISPLLSLMQDQLNRLRKLGEKGVVMLSSLQTHSQRERALRQMSQYKFIFASPETITQPEVQSALLRASIDLIVIDEAHCISQWGPDFRPEYLLLKEFVAQFNATPVLMLTATATPKVADDVITKLGMPQSTVQVVRRSVNRANIFLDVQTVENQSEKRNRLLQLISQIDGSGVIYFSSRKVAEQTADWLNEQLDFPVAAYHAGLDSDSRYKLQQQFMLGSLKVICATSAFGMGIDKDDIRFVIHYHLPANIENYVQEIGRAGRDGSQSIAILLYQPGDESLQITLTQPDVPSESLLQRFLTGQLTGDNLGATNGVLAFYKEHHYTATQIIAILTQQREKATAKLWTMLNYVNSPDCKRNLILQSFGEQPVEHTKDCCAGTADVVDFERLGMHPRPRQVEQVAAPSWLNRLEQLFFDKT